MKIASLKSCPCCGGQPKYTLDNGVFVECSDCWLRTCRFDFSNYFKIREEYGESDWGKNKRLSLIVAYNKAAEYWNRRSHQQPLN